MRNISQKIFPVLRKLRKTAQTHCVSCAKIAQKFAKKNARKIIANPDILCWYLETDQIGSVTWFMDWIVKSLEGVEVHFAAADKA